VADKAGHHVLGGHDLAAAVDQVLRPAAGPAAVAAAVTIAAVAAVVVG
jgi:hypothetical protein